MGRAGRRSPGREILAYPRAPPGTALTPVDTVVDPGTVGEVGEISAVQIAYHLDEWAARRKARRGVILYRRGDFRRLKIQGELSGQRTVDTHRSGGLPTEQCGPRVVEIRFGWVHLDDGLAGHGQRAVVPRDVKVVLMLP